MSVIPLPARISDGSKAFRKPRDVPGTANVLYGHRLAQRNQNRRNIIFSRDKQSHRPSSGKSAHILPSDPNSEGINDDDVREYNSILRTYYFEERTNKRILGNNIRHLVNKGMAEYEKDISARREKLRSMILSEEMSLTREIIDQAQRGADSRLDEMRKQSQELRERLEKERLATVTSKRLQQYLAQSPDARLRFSEKTTRQTKYSNLVQMAENEARRQAERELDGLWYGLMMKEVAAKKARETEEEKRRAIAGKSMVVTLEKQIASKLALTEEEKRVKEEELERLKVLWESVKLEEQANLEREKSKRAKLKRDLEEQLAAAKSRLAERARDEAAVERMFRELGEAELAREKAAIKESSSRLGYEIAAYMRSLEELREEEARREAEVEAVVQASAKEIETKRHDAKVKAKEARAQNIRELLEGREQQLRAKRIAHEKENKLEKAHGELQRRESEKEAALKVETEARRRENAVRYGQELKAQQKYVEIMRLREKEENKKILRGNLEREEEYQKLAEQLLNAPEIITPHVFKILAKECSGRRDAEQKGLCYYSQPTAPTAPTGGP